MTQIENGGAGEMTAPGPWRVKAPHPINACAYVGKQDGYVEVATCYGGDDDTPQPKDGESWGDQPIRDANARLIALAPTIAAELLDALTRIATLQARVSELEGALKRIAELYQVTHCHAAARAALNTTEGGEG
ncbi:hypothetical protein [Paracoccus shanxieyensis]|uniref:Uncharacterized protein n=1 Tax=Paracoccus shanxieyensis TaxID=2675752 RepID=A0A6L6IZ66_9RHOB|nr:hypothetical protein [Paracoccus shanxieyensis]MTH65786.1 hypothetical protein [Paracoccus shanxieyensis]MTH88839.1 hypothetical protein [Paracoccus shanxieyensis]